MAKSLLAILTILFNFILISDCASLARINSTEHWLQIENNILKGKEDTVDCLGLGKWTAKVLEWLLKDKPRPSGEERVKFFIHSRAFKSPYQFYADESDNEIQYSDFKPERKTVFIVHGFLAHGEDEWIKNMTAAYLNLEDVNVIVVDWSEYSNIFNYYKAVVNARNAALEITKLLKQVIDFFPNIKTWGSIHMIGHSLGSHVCGLAAEEFKKIPSGWTIARITALDPAQPCFVATDLSLDKNDADFVDVIHTNGKMVAGIGLGLVEPIGHVDFYPNGGKRQPGCWKNESTWDSFGIPHSDVMEAICSHKKSYEYFIESLKLEAEGAAEKFWGHSWDQLPNSAVMVVGEDCNGNVCTEMGINAVKYKHRGVFFVTTASNSPFSVIKPSDRMDVLEQLEIDALDMNKSMY